MLISHDDLHFLKNLTADVVAAATVQPGQQIFTRQNNTGITFIRPGGIKAYPALWIRDFVMSLECGLLPPDIAENMLRYIAKFQAAETLSLPTGGVIPAGSIPDHISMNGEPIYYPGTYDFNDQGDPMWGKYPPFDDHFMFIEGLYHLPQIPFTQYAEQAEKAFAVTPADANGLVECDENDRGVSFGFTDAIVHTGKLLFASLLRALAAKRLAELFKDIDAAKAEQYRKLSGQISGQIAETFMMPSGFLRASTGIGSQADVWGSSLAVYYGLIPEMHMDQISCALLDALQRKTINWRGYIRHVPSDAMANKKSYWERTHVAFNRYQNGAFWSTPTGWVAYAVHRKDPQMAAQLIKEYISDLREFDFRKNMENCGAPWECIHEECNYRNNPVYMTSVTCPFAAVMRMVREE